MKTTTDVKERIDTPRERAAGVLEKAGDIVRDRSHQAAEFIDRGGNRAAEALRGSAERVQPERGFVRRHPKRSALFLAFALLTAAFTLLLIRNQFSSDEDEDDDFDF